MENGYSLSDLKAVTGDSGLGGNGGWILILLFAMIFGNGGFFGNRQGDFSQFATSASQSEILLGQKFDALSRQINQVGDGLCSSTYALNNSIINEGRTLGASVNTGFANLQNCCCDLKYDMATQFANTNANTTAQTQKILDALAQNKIDTLQSQVGTLQNQLALQTAMCGVPKINPYMYGIVPQYQGCSCGNI